jgi:hypothetical protein
VRGLEVDLEGLVVVRSDGRKRLIEVGERNGRNNRMPSGSECSVSPWCCVDGEAGGLDCRR